MSEEADFLYHEPCPNCPSSDAFGRYSDGHGYCFSCGYYQPGDDAPGKEVKRRVPKDIWSDEEYDAQYRELKRRGITQETCEKFGYKSGKRKGKAVQVATYYRDRQPVAQKVRFKDKDFIFLGETKKAPLYGQWLWRDGGKMVVITEGEIDAMSVSQVQGNKWPVVSVQNGAHVAKKSLQKEIEWLEKFDTIVLMFDMDEPGQDAAKECAELFTPGKAKIAELPLKDANEMLVEGRGKELINAIWAAKPYRPDGLVSFADIVGDIEKPVEYGLPWCFPTLTDYTYGRREGEVYFFGAGTGVGKTDVFTQSIAFDATELNERVGVFYLEQEKAETGKRIAGKVAGKLFHIPNAGWTPEELHDAVHDRRLTDNITLFDSFGVTEWDVIKSKIMYLAHSGVRLFYIDHLTALATGQDGNEKEILEEVTADMAKLAKRLGIILHVVSHLATPEGKSHEEGGMVVPKHFKGSRAIAFWAYFMFGMERNTLAEDPQEQKLTTFRILKDRYTGRSTGHFFFLTYEEATGRLVETSAPKSEKDAEDMVDEEF